MFACFKRRASGPDAPYLSAIVIHGSTMQAELVTRADEIRQRLKQLGDSL